MPADKLFELAGSRTNGVSKSELFKMCDEFDLPLYESEWTRMQYCRSKGMSLPVYCKGKRWFSFESEYFVALVKFIQSNPKENTDMGMAMGPVPSWITRNHELFIKTFPLKDFQ